MQFHGMLGLQIKDMPARNRSIIQKVTIQPDSDRCDILGNTASLVTLMMLQSYTYPRTRNDSHGGAKRARRPSKPQTSILATSKNCISRLAVVLSGKSHCQRDCRWRERSQSGRWTVCRELGGCLICEGTGQSELRTGRGRAEDGVVQRHGRWKSFCLAAYTEIARRTGGTIIASDLQKSQMINTFCL
jgi:hypothetical protein